MRSLIISHCILYNALASARHIIITGINSKELAVGILALFRFIHFLLLSVCCCYCYFKVISLPECYPFMGIPRNEMISWLPIKNK